MLRQDSIHSADIRSKGSPFRAKCHEIFCCPLKQAVHKESAEPEGLSATPPCFLICRCSSYPSAPLPASPAPTPYKVLFHFCPIGEHLVYVCPFIACVCVCACANARACTAKRSKRRACYLVETITGHLSPTLFASAQLSVFVCACACLPARPLCWTEEHSICSSGPPLPSPNH